MVTRRYVLSLLALAGLALVLPPLPAVAQSADALRASGAAGERWDGYMVARDGSAAGAVAAINAERRGVYEARAAERGVPAVEVGKVYHQQIVQQAPAGTWIQAQDGRWSQK